MLRRTHPAPPRGLNRAEISRPEGTGGLQVFRRCSLTQPRPESNPGTPDSVCAGDHPPRSRAPATSRRRPARPSHPGRPIWNPRPWLDPKLIKSQPSDPDPTVQIGAYRFAWHFC